MSDRDFGIDANFDIDKEIDSIEVKVATNRN